jgi:hypothetical protein
MVRGPVFPAGGATLVAASSELCLLGKQFLKRDFMFLTNLFSPLQLLSVSRLME